MEIHGLALRLVYKIVTATQDI